MIQVVVDVVDMMMVVVHLLATEQCFDAPDTVCPSGGRRLLSVFRPAVCGGSERRVHGMRIAWGLVE